MLAPVKHGVLLQLWEILSKLNILLGLLYVIKIKYHT